MSLLCFLQCSPNSLFLHPTVTTFYGYTVFSHRREHQQFLLRLWKLPWKIFYPSPLWTTTWGNISTEPHLSCVRVTPSFSNLTHSLAHKKKKKKKSVAKSGFLGNSFSNLSSGSIFVWFQCKLGPRGLGYYWLCMYASSVLEILSYVRASFIRPMPEYFPSKLMVFSIKCLVCLLHVWWIVSFNIVVCLIAVWLSLPSVQWEYHGALIMVESAKIMPHHANCFKWTPKDTCYKTQVIY